MASNKKSLKAYIRFDGTGRAIAGSLILQRFKPKVGNWKQIGAYECCDPSCLPPVYGQDFIIDDVINAETGVFFVIETNPITNVLLEVAMISCESTPPNRILPLQIELIPPGSVGPNTFYYFVPNEILAQTCAIGFRRVCSDNVSGWDLGLG